MTTHAASNLNLGTGQPSGLTALVARGQIGGLDFGINPAAFPAPIPPGGPPPLIIPPPRKNARDEAPVAIGAVGPDDIDLAHADHPCDPAGDWQPYTSHLRGMKPPCA
jgi:hypothetical protein